ncbi:MAG TPA: hypothetical protein VE974_18075 [Thermoanaerobaculia bacterium]|nr:hypothetical protein [Thermoanaerobaculia bacterium]
MKGKVPAPTAAAEATWLLIDYVDMCRILGPLPFPRAVPGVVA